MANIATLRPTGVTRLIVNADDYGYTPGVSRGIVQAAEAGVVTSTTAMANMPGVADEIGTLRSICPGLGIGAHLNLTADRPLTPAKRVPSLVDPDGVFRGLADILAAPGSVNPTEVMLEWSAQVEMLLALDVAVDHLDSHHHVAYLVPSCAEALLKLASEYQLPVRRPPQPPGADPAVAASILSCREVRMPDVFAGEMMSCASVQAFEAILDRIPRGTVAEIMVHPGEVDAELQRTSSYVEPRAIELSTLLNPRILALLEGEQVRVCSFAEVFGSA